MSINRRVMVFLDGSNLFWGRNQYNKENKTDLRIDYRKLIDHLVGGRQIVRATYYCSKPIPPRETQIRFIDYLRKSGIQVIEKELRTRTNLATGETKSVEKGVDVALAIDLLGMAWEGAYDDAIVISGDADYVGAIDKVMSKGKNVEIASYRQSCSRELRGKALKTTFIDDIANIIKKT